MKKEWIGFTSGPWEKTINVSDFIKKNYKKYDDDESFLVGISKDTKIILKEYKKLLRQETKSGGVLDIDTSHISGIDNFKPGYIDKRHEHIFGLQTDKPLKRIVNPYGGMRMVYQELEAYDYELSPNLDKYFNMFRKTHNQGVFDAYTEEIRKARRVGLLTGLPDMYGRGRIIGDYRRVSLYGIDYLISEKQKDLSISFNKEMNDETIRLREEISMQIKALEEMKSMALKYGFDISKPASNSFEAVQWLYFAYLASIKENNGAAMSLGRIDAFLDIYFERDLENKTITEEKIQELIDQFVIKLRLVRHLRTPEYDELFSGDPTWVTCALGGLTTKGKSMVTKTSYRLLHTLITLETAPEPNMTVLWGENLPETWKKYCAKMSIDTDAIQYENDDIMKPIYGDDYAIACCVSAMTLGKDMQFFGARCNLAKALLYSINGGIDEMKGDLIIPGFSKDKSEILKYDKVIKSYDKMLDKVCDIYVKAMNIIHYMHDKYAYEASQMALHDSNVRRLMAYGIAGFSVVVDSLSAIKYAKVKPIRNEEGIAVDFDIEGDYPKYGNDDDKVDAIAKDLAKRVYKKLSSHKCYRDAVPTLSVLTITSNVVYGEKTGSTPDGRKKGKPFSPGANPMHGRDTCGAIASLNSVAKINYAGCCQDGVSNTFSIAPCALGNSESDQVENLVSLLDGYFIQGAHHLNVNVLNKEMLIDAMHHPEKYPLLTVRVSGYAVRFNSLTRKQQEEVIARTLHKKV